MVMVGIGGVLVVLMSGGLVLAAPMQPIGGFSAFGNRDSYPRGEYVIVTPKMTSNDSPQPGEVSSTGNRNGEDVGYKAFDRKLVNLVPMFCPSGSADCDILTLTYKSDPCELVTVDMYSLYVAHNIPAEYKPAQWSLYGSKGGFDAWHLIDTVEVMDWSETEVYNSALDRSHEFCSFMLTITNPLDDQGNMVATISELELKHYDRSVKAQ